MRSPRLLKPAEADAAYTSAQKVVEMHRRLSLWLRPGQPTPEVARLAACGKESLRRGVRELRPGNRFLDFAKAVQGYAEGECGYHLIRGLGGHGYGQTLHAAPFVANTLPTYPGEWPDA